jgi:hypothetical protein
MRPATVLPVVPGWLERGSVAAASVTSASNSESPRPSGLRSWAARACQWGSFKLLFKLRSRPSFKLSGNAATSAGTVRRTSMGTCSWTPSVCTVDGKGRVVPRGPLNHRITVLTWPKMSSRGRKECHWQCSRSSRCSCQWVIEGLGGCMPASPWWCPGPRRRVPLAVPVVAGVQGLGEARVPVAWGGAPCRGPAPGIHDSPHT